jgi:hypothetical protein
MTWLELCRAGNRRFSPQSEFGNDQDEVRGFIGAVQGHETLVNIVGARILRGFDQEADTAAGLVRVEPIANYQETPLGIVTRAPSLRRLARGTSAMATGITVQETGLRLAKFAAQFVIDEQDLLEGATLAIDLAVVEEIGRAFRRALLDAIWATLLSNPTLADGVACFHANHANTTTGALAAGTVQTAMGLLGGQTLTDHQDTQVPVHLNLRPTTLVVPPAMHGAALSVVNGWIASDVPIVRVVSESRISATGCWNPLTESLVTGTNTNYLLLASASQRAGVVVGALEGRLQPRFSSWELSHGEWGMGFAADASFNVAIVDHRPLVFSTGV